jgi:hypothetical protein
MRLGADDREAARKYARFSGAIGFGRVAPNFHRYFFSRNACVDSLALALCCGLFLSEAKAGMRVKELNPGMQQLLLPNPRLIIGCKDSAELP